MKRFSDKIGPFSIALAFLMPVAIESALLAEVVPEVLIEEKKEKSSLDDDIKHLKKKAEEAEKLQNYSQAIDLYKRAFSIPSLLILFSLYIFEKSDFASLYFFNFKYVLPLSRKHLG